MGITRTDLFTEEQNEIALFAKCFAHPARVAILEYLLQKNECVNSTLVTELGLAQATISQHLKELKQLGLIKGNIEGTSVCYCINKPKWLEMKKLMSEFLDQDISLEPNCC
jgi:DNA-binding transcriptional ArsR family regulator